MGDNFPWDDSDVVCIPRTDAIAVYGTKDEIIIRQQGHGPAGDPEDQIIGIPRSRVPDLIAALRKELAATGFDNDQGGGQGISLLQPN